MREGWLDGGRENLREKVEREKERWKEPAREKGVCVSERGKARMRKGGRLKGREPDR